MMMLGTHWGKTHQLDAMGNVIGSGNAEHSVTVTQMSIDHIGENVASCSIDGKVSVRGLLSNEVEFSADLNRPVRAVSIDPVYFRSGQGCPEILLYCIADLNKDGFEYKMSRNLLMGGEFELQ